MGLLLGLRLLLTLLGRALARFAGIGRIVGNLREQQISWKGPNAQSAEIWSLNANARTGTDEPQIGPAGQQQSQTLFMVLRKRRQILDQECHGDIVGVLL